MNHEHTPGWSVFKQIFHDHWDQFKQDHPRYDRIYYNELVQKMIGCGNPEQSGFFEYRCRDCGQGKHVVAMSCKSALCLRCAKVYVDNWVSQVSQSSLQGSKGDAPRWRHLSPHGSHRPRHVTPHLLL